MPISTVIMLLKGTVKFSNKNWSINLTCTTSKRTTKIFNTDRPFNGFVINLDTTDCWMPATKCSYLAFLRIEFYVPFLPYSMQIFTSFCKPQQLLDSRTMSSAYSTQLTNSDRICMYCMLQKFRLLIIHHCLRRWLWPPYVIGAIIFLPCDFYRLSSIVYLFFLA